MLLSMIIGSPTENLSSEGTAKKYTKQLANSQDS